MTAPDNACPVEQEDEQLARGIIGMLVGSLAAQSKTNVDRIAPYLAGHRVRTLPPIAEVMERVARAIFDSFTPESMQAHGATTWLLLDEATRDVWRKAALAALTNLQTGVK
jgi:hypothetical protein